MNLNQVTLPANDLSQGVAFYQLLGLKLIVDALPDYVRFECPAGDSTFSLHKAPLPETDSGVAVYFECELLEQECERLQKAGLKFELLPTMQPWRWEEARLRDPAGNLIILFRAGEDRKNPPWRIN